MESSKSIGLYGAFFDSDKENNLITYQNAIEVSYFSKIGISDTVPQVIGTELHFEYRQLTQEEREQSLLFHSDATLICNINIAPPPANPFFITKLLNY